VWKDICGLLWSINERLGGHPGADIAKPTNKFELDMISLYLAEIDETERREEQSRD
jgi:hypothetical protein